MTSGRVKRTPPITSKGLFEVREPFKVDERTIYEVISLREFEDLESQHIDIFQMYYKPVGAEEADFNADKAMSACIVGLRSHLGVTYVPDTYILNYPEMGYTNYQHTVVSVSLGAIHRDRNISAVITDINNVIERHLGIKAQAKLHVAPTTDAITELEAKRLEDIRRGVMDVPNSEAMLYRWELNKNRQWQQANNAKLAGKKNSFSLDNLNNELKMLFPGDAINPNRITNAQPLTDKDKNNQAANPNTLQNLVAAGNSFYSWLTNENPQTPVPHPSLAGKKGTSMFSPKNQTAAVQGWVKSLGTK